MCNAADALIAQGAKDVLAYITHGVLSGGAVDRVMKSRLRELVVSDTIAPTPEQRSALEHPHLADRAADRGGDRAHREGRERFEPVRLVRAGSAKNPESCLFVGIHAFDIQGFDIQGFDIHGFDIEGFDMNSASGA